MADFVMESIGAESGYGAVPHEVLAYGWIPFLVVTLLSLLFSLCYVLWFRTSEARSPGATTISILGILISLLAAALVPVDVFLVSYMKNSNGTWKSWATDESARDSIKDTVLYSYYFLYGLIVTFCFLIIPANFFYHGETTDEMSVNDKLCKSFKYTLISLFLFSVLVVAGIFIPFNGAPPSNTTDIQKIEWFLDELKSNKGEDLLVFILNVINLIGFCLLIFYTGYGLSFLPCGLIWTKRSVDAQQSNVENSLEELERQITQLKARHGENPPSRFEQSQLDRLEQQAGLLRREQKDLEQRAKTAVNRCLLFIKPFQMLIGVVFSAFGFLIFLSLLLTNVDKAINSHGPYTGYTLQNSTLPNPLDMLLVLAQKIFPMDYILYSLLVLFLVICSMSGISSLGVRFLWMRVYTLKAWQTPARGLLLAVLSLMYIILAMSVVMFSLVPDYTMFGDQYYRRNETHGNVTQEIVIRCGSDYFPEGEDNCVPSRISVLLLSFHYKAWIFGAFYYWLTWLLLVAVSLGSLFSVHRLRKARNGLEGDGEEEPLLPPPGEIVRRNPFEH